MTWIVSKSSFISSTTMCWVLEAVYCGCACPQGIHSPTGKTHKSHTPMTANCAAGYEGKHRLLKENVTRGTNLNLRKEEYQK